MAVERFGPRGAVRLPLTVGELVQHKRVDLALEAAQRAREHLKVVGTGPSLASLGDRYVSTAEFLGRISDIELGDLYAHAIALIVANVEESGIGAVDAQAAGTSLASTLVIRAAVGHRGVHDGDDGPVARFGESRRCRTWRRRAIRSPP